MGRFSGEFYRQIKIEEIFQIIRNRLTYHENGQKKFFPDYGDGGSHPSGWQEHEWC